VDVDSAALGVSVAVRVPALYETDDGTSVVPGPRSSMAIVAGWTSSLNVAVTVVPTETPVAPGAGLRADTVGGVVS
jgi:hypothetical protein